MTSAPNMGENMSTLQFAFATIGGTTARAPQISCIHGIDIQLGITGLDELVCGGRVELQVDDCDSPGATRTRYERIYLSTPEPR